jgi:hypothetical protein
MARLETENGESCIKFCNGVIAKLYAQIEANVANGEYMRSGGYKALKKDIKDLSYAYNGEKRIKELGQPAQAALETFVCEKV